MSGKMLIFVFAAALCAVAGASAADVTGTVSGVVRDSSGALVPGAELIATNIGTNAIYSAISDDTGVYFIRSVPAGIYTLTAELKGFKKFESKGIRVQVNEAARVDVTLSLGETTETVLVSAKVITVDT